MSEFLSTYRAGRFAGGPAADPLRRAIVGALVASFAAAALRAEEVSAGFPNRTLRFVVPFAPGGSVDVLGRSVAKMVGEICGRQTVVENMPGASTNLASEHVARALPDGYTVLVASDSLAINKSLFRHLTFDPVGSFQPITLAITAPQILVTHPNSGLRTLTDFIDAARAKPGSLNVGIPGAGVIGHLASEIVNRKLGLRVTHIPYNGGAPATRDLLGGHVDAIYITLPAVTSLVRGGALVPLAVTSRARSTAIAAAPAFAETVLPELDIVSWQGFLAPAGTPEDIAASLHRLISAALQSEAVGPALADFGYDIIAAGPRPFAMRVQADVTRFAEVVREAGVQVQ